MPCIGRHARSWVRVTLHTHQCRHTATAAAPDPAPAACSAHVHGRHARVQVAGKAAKALPAAISGKSKEELQALVLTLIKKSKAQDKRIEGAGRGQPPMYLFE
jgi:hypothetical protein